MTYRELIDALKNLNSEQLEQEAMLHFTGPDEFIPVQFVGVACRVETSCDLSDEEIDHIVLGSE